MADLQAQKCVARRSSWVRYFIEMCDRNLAVQFYDSHHPHHPRKSHPRPDVCCYYPNSVGLFDLAVVWASPGRFVHEFLYRKRPYWIIKPPCPPQGCGEVNVGCCPSVLLPNTVHATVAGCGCINGTYALAWNGTQWQGTFDASACGHAQGMNLILSCPSGGACTDFSLRFQCNSSSFSTVYAPQAGCACNPLNLVFSFTQSAGELGSPCCPNTAITVTITP